MISPYFSIILPVLNAEQTIRKALSSIQRQTFQDFELLVLDGGSTDQTLQQVARFGGTRSRLVSEADYGVYDAMNKGISLAKGQWLYFLGADDCLYEDSTLQKVEEAIRGVPEARLIYGNVLRPGQILYGGRFTYRTLLERSICHQSLFYRKDVFGLFGYYNMKYLVYADQAFNFKLFYGLDESAIIFVDQIIARFSEGGLSSREFDNAFWRDIPKIYADAIKNDGPKIVYRGLARGEIAHFYFSAVPDPFCHKIRAAAILAWQGRSLQPVRLLRRPLIQSLRGWVRHLPGYDGLRSMYRRVFG
ncbi:MAG: glycosyltransferase family 2 protein [Chromatiaceae bacterium]